MLNLVNPAMHKNELEYKPKPLFRQFLRWDAGFIDCCLTKSIDSCSPCTASGHLSGKRHLCRGNNWDEAWFFRVEPHGTPVCLSKDVVYNLPGLTSGISDGA